jgi:hypothetical protein
MEKAGKTFCALALLCLAPFFFLGCRSAPEGSAPAACAWTVEDAGWFDDNGSHAGACEGYVSLALNLKGGPQVMYLLVSHLRGPGGKYGNTTLCRAWQEDGKWKREDLASVYVGIITAQLAFDRDGRPVVAVWTRQAYPSVKEDSFILTRDTEWKSQPIPIRSPDFCMALDSSGAMHIAWPEGAEIKHAAYRYSERLETVGAVKRAHPKPYEFYHSLVMDVDRSDNVHLAYVDDTGLHYGLRTSDGWKIENVDSSLTVEGRVAIDTDNSGNPHLVYEDGRDGIMYAWRDAQGWHSERIGVGRQPSIDVDRFSGIPYVTYVRANRAYFKDSGDGRLVLACRIDGKWRDRTINTQVAAGSSTDIKLHYDGTAPVSIGVAFQSSIDNNNIKFASAQFTKGKAILAIFGSFAPLIFCLALGANRRHSSGGAQ